MSTYFTSSVHTSEPVLEQQKAIEITNINNVSVSRRRLAFRPQFTATKPTKNIINLSDIAQENRTNVENLRTMGVSPANISTCDLEQKSSRRRLVTSWSFQEMLVFYEGLKQHGKDFEAIARFMNKKKISKDKDHIRNYYFNTFKIWKAKAQIEETDWINVPRDARELFVILNGCEWRKRTGGSYFDSAKFKSLILNGCTSVRVKKKKSMVMIRTPYCLCLLKFFPYDKRNSEIPSLLSIKLTPLTFKDRNYVISCEQNPLLHLQINVNDKLSSIFSLLERKWILPIDKIANSLNSQTSKNLVIRLHVNKNIQIHKVYVEMNEDNSTTHPLMSLGKLKKDYNVVTDSSKEPSSSDNNQTDDSNGPIVKRAKECSVIKLSGASVKEVFDIDEAKIKEGLTKENVVNASVLQLFYLFGMIQEIRLSYEIEGCEIENEPWKLFVSLVSRDYGELISKHLNNNNIPIEMPKTITNTLCKSVPVVVTTTSSITNTTNVNIPNLNSNADSSKRKRYFKLSSDQSSDIVEEENIKFLEQLNHLKQQNSHKRPKRQVKLVANNNKKNLSNNVITYSNTANDLNNTRIECTTSTGNSTEIIQEASNFYGESTSNLLVPVKTNQILPTNITYFIAADPSNLQNNVTLKPIHSLNPNNSSFEKGEQQQTITIVQQSPNKIPFGIITTAEPQSTSQNNFLSPPQPTDFSHLFEASRSLTSTSMICTPSTSFNFNVPSTTTNQHNNNFIQYRIIEHRTPTKNIKTGNDETEQNPVVIESSMDSFSMYSFTNQTLVSNPSPSKTLPDDVRNSFEQMLNQNSVDYCRNFEQLTRNIDIIHKNFNNN